MILSFGREVAAEGVRLLLSSRRLHRLTHLSVHTTPNNFAGVVDSRPVAELATVQVRLNSPDDARAFGEWPGSAGVRAFDPLDTPAEWVATLLATSPYLGRLRWLRSYVHRPAVVPDLVDVLTDAGRLPALTDLELGWAFAPPADAGRRLKARFGRGLAIWRIGGY